jgi:hypothetical protein
MQGRNKAKGIGKVSKVKVKGVLGSYILATMTRPVLKHTSEAAYSSLESSLFMSIRQSFQPLQTLFAEEYAGLSCALA